MTALTDVYHHSVIHLRTAVIVAYSKVRKSAQDVKTCKHATVPLDHCDIRLYLCDKRSIYLHLKGIYPFFSSENLLLVLLQFLGDISLRIDKSLLSDPLLRNIVLMCITNFQIISEDIVEAYLERRYSGTLNLALLDFKEIILAMTGNLPQLVELLIDAARNHITLSELRSRFRVHGRCEEIKKFRTISHLGDKFIKSLNTLALAKLHYRSGLTETTT